MRVIPVIDLLGGQVVRGVAGRRAEYRPILSQIAADARPATVARALVERFGFDTVYVADLDAIEGRARNVPAWEEIGDAPQKSNSSLLKLWLDAGVGDHHSCWQVSELTATRAILADIVVGLESIKRSNCWHLVAEIRQYHTPIFSLDLLEGVPQTSVPEWKQRSAIEIAIGMYEAGIRNMIVLDLADVGVSGGTRTLELCRSIRSELRDLELVSGGGVRGLDDLKALADAGCAAALVASALHDGRLSREDIERAKEF